MWLDVPWVKQDKNGCGSASVWMVMQYWNHQVESLDTIHRTLYSESAGGVFASDMEEYFTQRGYQTFVFKGQWADLEQHLTKGRPLIVVLERNARGVPLHYVVVAGINSAEGVVLVNDPAERKLHALERSQFEKQWKAAGEWTLLAVPQIELASDAFRGERFSDAAKHLESALRVEPSDQYTNEFIATVHLLNNDVESALKYWNRLGKPLVNEIQFDPPLRTRPALLDRALMFRRGSQLTLEDYKTTRARLDATGVFSRYQIELSPSGSSEERFDVTIRAAERSGPQFLSWLRGLPYKTLHPEFLNIGGRALNVKSILRWDSDRRKTAVTVDAPFAGDPGWIYRAEAVGRDENWTDGTTASRLRKASLAMHIHSIPSGNWNWTSGIALSRQEGGGFGMKYLASVRRTVLNAPGKRLTLASFASVEVGKQFATSTRFAKISGELSSRWFPYSADDYEFNTKLHVGKVGGPLSRIPIDELIVFGLDRDPALPVRGHSVLSDGSKSVSATTSSIVLVNTELHKNLAETAFLRFQAGPFLDAARPAGSAWLFDAGAQLRITALNTFTFTFILGRDLRTGRSTFFAN
jgi:predicted double-glycine peptidase